MRISIKVLRAFAVVLKVISMLCLGLNIIMMFVSALKLYQGELIPPNNQIVLVFSWVGWLMVLGISELLKDIANWFQRRAARADDQAYAY